MYMCIYIYMFYVNYQIHVDQTNFLNKLYLFYSSNYKAYEIMGKDFDSIEESRDFKLKYIVQLIM